MRSIGRIYPVYSTKENPTVPNPFPPVAIRSRSISSPFSRQPTMNRSIVLALFSLFAIPHASFGADSRPNVLFIAIDDLRDWAGYFGHYPGAKTPNLDRLAKKGMAFTRAYCAAPVCNPSRCALLSGLRPSTTGVYDTVYIYLTHFNC